mgnify:CR=1 FL=1
MCIRDRYLAAAGIGTIGIVDGDVVEVSNLQRQVIHGGAWVGRSKARSAAHRIADLNPHCRVEVHDVMLTIDNALELIRPYDVVCDGTDNFTSRYLINDACVLLGKPMVYGSVQRFDGQVSVFNRGPGRPDYRDLLPEPPSAGEVPSCAEAGVMGVLPGLVGLIQATETIKLITGHRGSARWSFAGGGWIVDAFPGAAPGEGSGPGGGPGPD